MTSYFRRSKHAASRKKNTAIHTLFILFLMESIFLQSCMPPGPATRPAALPATETFESTEAVNLAATSLAFVAQADAQVNEANPGRNTGISTFLQVDGGNDPEVESFIRFTVTGLTSAIQTAHLRVYDTTNASANGPAIYATGVSWTESAINWNNRPARMGNELDNQESIGRNSWVEYDVTTAVTGNGGFSFVLAADSNDAATFSSREGPQAPELVITLADGPTATVDAATTTASSPSATSTSATQTPGTSLLFLAEADARVKQTSPGNNYGNATTLQVDGAENSSLESFIRFTVTGISGPVQRAQLRVYTLNNETANGPAVYATAPSWTEAEITWNNRPSRTSDALDNKASLSPNAWVEYDVTAEVTGNGTFSFVLAGDSSDGVNFSSRQGIQPPELAITLMSNEPSTATPSIASPAPGEGITFVGAGDISSCDNDNDELTAQLLDAIPGTVFTTGDNAYNSGTYNEYLNCYDPTWGRHKDRTQPTPGNHEYRSDGAAGYFQYFNNVPSYYAYNLGVWRIYALNSEIDVSGGSSQVAWLQSDLAANPSQCVLAYWHQPRWSSGDNHGSDPDLQILWQTLYEADAELVLNGHEHNYERFAPMNAAGQADPLGLREIVVGTGGRNHYEFGTVLPTSEVRDSSTFGVLKLTLRADGYDWEFVPVAGSIFTDSGSTSCH
jgi:acid phosphatase type 7